MMNMILMSILCANDNACGITIAIELGIIRSSVLEDITQNRVGFFFVPVLSSAKQTGVY